ncbi:MAG TPA: O-antigen ligase family protein [Candidatus Hydrogenedentes bacterium]|nr:O-antigen ligase family protein [Candidatus Hydrogenedentota bacterium]
MQVMDSNRQGGESSRGRTQWALFLLIAGAFFVIEHDTQSPELFNLLMTAESLEEFGNIEQMYQPRAWRQAGALLLGAMGFFFIIQKRRSGEGRLDMLGALMIFFLLWSGLSMAWSDDPALSFRRYVMFALLCVGAAGIAGRLTLHDILRMAVFIPAAYLAAGVALEMATGYFRPFASGYRFTGTVHPNIQAVNCALMFFAALALWRGASENRRRWLFLAALAFVFIVLTRSRTALASSIFVLVFQWGLMQPYGKKVAVTSFLAAAAMLVLIAGDVILPAVGERLQMGRTDRGEFRTLTGRTALWRQCSEFLREHPVLGYGYGAFWNEERSTEIIEEQGWPISHAHNAYFDTALESGPLATMAYLLILLMGIYRAMARFRLTGNPAYAFFGAILLFCAVNGMLESVAIQRTMLTFFTVIMLARLTFYTEPLESVQENEAMLSRKALNPSGRMA